MSTRTRLNPFGEPVVSDWQPDSTKAPPKRTLDERKVEALERIADALEARNAIDGKMAEFAELLQQGAPQVAHEGHPDLAPDGQPWGKRQ